MARIKIIICILIAFFVFKTEMKAQEDSTIYFGMNWYLKKSAAFKAAREQGKHIFLIWGFDTCPDCQWLKRKLSEPPFRDIMDKNYVPWFSDCFANVVDSEEVGVYLTALKDVSRHYVPFICLIDKEDLSVQKTFMYGPDFELNNVTKYKDKIDKYYEDLTALIYNHVSNDNIYDGNIPDGAVYVVDNNLVIESKSADETVSVFALTGSLVDRFHKTEYNITRNLSGYPKSVLIVTGSSGWTKKVIIR